MTTQADRILAFRSLLQGIAFAVLTFLFDHHGVVGAIIAGVLFGGLMYAFQRRRLVRHAADRGTTTPR